MYSWSNANNLKFTCYENGKRITIFDVCARVSDYSDGKVKLDDLHTTNVDINRDYDLIMIFLIIIAYKYQCKLY